MERWGNVWCGVEVLGRAGEYGGGGKLKFRSCARSIFAANIQWKDFGNKITNKTYSPRRENAT